MPDTVVFRAKSIITMNPRQPRATHVAIRDGWILGAGSLEDLSGWGEYELDDRLADHVLMPGFVEGHCHSWEGSAWEDPYLGYYDRTAPDRVNHRGCKSIDDVIDRLAGASNLDDNDSGAVMGWGLDPIFLERRMVAADLDRVAADRPVIVMHQSGHIINVNSTLLRWANIDRNTNVQGLVRDANGEPTGELQGPALRDAGISRRRPQSILGHGRPRVTMALRPQRSARRGDHGHRSGQRVARRNGCRANSGDQPR